jgi:hypothetical protein
MRSGIYLAAAEMERNVSLDNYRRTDLASWHLGIAQSR